jgi:hypothetical protein
VGIEESSAANVADFERVDFHFKVVVTCLSPLSGADATALDGRRWRVSSIVDDIL